MGKPSTRPDHDAGAAHLFERLVFFSDAVFAIAITLLVLDLKLPQDARGRFIFDQFASKLFGFVLSFAVIGAYWLSHHALFGRLTREDRFVRVANLVFLGCIAFLPFPTSLIAEYRPTTFAVELYAASVAAVGIAQAALVLVASRPMLVRPGWTAGDTRSWMRRALVAPVVFLASIPVAQSDPVDAMRLWWLVAILSPLMAWLEKIRWPKLLRARSH